MVELVDVMDGVLAEDKIEWFLRRFVQIGTRGA